MAITPANNLESMAGWPTRYTNVQFCRAGSRSEIYAADDSEREERVAIKVYRPYYPPVNLDDEEKMRLWKTAPERFIREVKALSAIKDHGVTAFYDAFVIETDRGPQPFAVMEFVNAPSIADKQAQGFVADETYVRRLLRECGEAIDVLQENDIFHRDVKPDNIKDGVRFKFVDFGEAASGAQTHAGTVAGTLAYAPPEQRANGEYNNTTDRYALCRVAGELMINDTTKFLAWVYGNTPLEKLVEEGKFSAAIIDVVERGVDQDVEHRYRTSTALVTAGEQLDAYNRVRREIMIQTTDQNSQDRKIQEQQLDAIVSGAITFADAVPVIKNIHDDNIVRAQLFRTYLNARAEQDSQVRRFLAGESIVEIIESELPKPGWSKAAGKAYDEWYEIADKFGGPTWRLARNYQTDYGVGGKTYQALLYAIGTAVAVGCVAFDSHRFTQIPTNPIFSILGTGFGIGYSNLPRLIMSSKQKNRGKINQYEDDIRKEMLLEPRRALTETI